MQQTTAKEAALNIFAILGFIALLIAGLWATIQLLQLALSFVTGSSVGKEAQKAMAPLAALSQPHVTLKMPNSSATSGTPFAIGWSGDHVTNAGSLALSYACREGLFLKVSASRGVEYAVPCNAPYTIPSDATSLSITPVVSTNSVIDVPLTLTYTNGSASAKDTASVRVNGVVAAPALANNTDATYIVREQTEAVVTHTTPAPVPVAAKPRPLPPAPKPVVVEKPVQKSNPDGFVDLEARILSVGKPGPGNTTSPRATLRTQDTASITFEIRNNGTKAVRNWVYALTLPTDPTYTYDSEVQPTLYAGSKATITLSFDNLAAGTHPLTLTADPHQTTADTMRANNTAQVVLTVQ